jgi:hypothetical protein
MRKRLIPGCAAVLSAAVVLLLLFGMLGVFDRNAGRFVRKDYEAVIQQVRLARLKPGERRQFKLDTSDPKSLRPINSETATGRGGEGVGHVWVHASSDGNLKVVIKTRDLGHAGEYGFAYSDVPLSPTPFSGDWFSIDVPGHLNLVLPKMQIDPHWWRVFYNLD